jgi:hypothetical protein
MKLLSYFEDGYNMEKKYSTEQLIKFSEDIYNYWDKTERVILYISCLLRE